jgi:hypothetical protein
MGLFPSPSDRRTGPAVIMNQKASKLRRGVSLTELLLLMSSYTVILSMCGVLLHRVMRVEIDSRSFVEVERTSTRLSRQFRQDVNQAVTAETDATSLQNSAFLRLQLSDNQSIEYRWLEGSVVRTLFQDGRGSAHEEFAFDPSCKLIVRQDKPANRIVLSIAREALDSISDRTEQLRRYKACPMGLHVEASIGHETGIANVATSQERAK